MCRKGPHLRSALGRCRLRRPDNVPIRVAGVVYELSKSYSRVFFVIGGVYAVDALVFGGAALLQVRRQRRRRRSAIAAGDFARRTRAKLPSSCDVHLTTTVQEREPRADYVVNLDEFLQ